MDQLPENADAGSLARKLLRRLPGGRIAEEQLDRVERRVMLELKHRLERVEQPSSSLKVAVVSVRTGPREPSGPNAPGTILQDLLVRAPEQSREEAEIAYFVSVLRTLVPDEARILSALSGDSSYPVIHVLEAARLVGAGRPVLECISNVGRAAGVLAPDFAQAYVQRLRSYGLIEFGPEDEKQSTQYEMLETHTQVRSTIASLQKGGHRAQIVRRTLKLSALGNALWAACRIGEDP